MKRLLVFAVTCLLSFHLAGQSFEISGIQESYKATIGDVIKAPVLFKNTSSKPLTLIIKKTSGLIGTSQKNYFCHDGHCLDQKVEDYNIRVEPGQTLSSFQVALEAGLVPGISSVRYTVYNKANPAEAFELDFHFIVEEKQSKANIYTSRLITLQEVYPNPAHDAAYLDYKILADRVKAKIIVHNVLGNKVGEYDLPAMESKLKISTNDLNSGIYFYTLYLDGSAKATGKLLVDN